MRGNLFRLLAFRLGSIQKFLWPSMFAKRFVSAENRGRGGPFVLPSTFASITKIGLLQDSNTRTPASQTFSEIGVDL